MPDNGALVALTKRWIVRFCGALEESRVDVPKVFCQTLSKNGWRFDPFGGSGAT